MGSVGLMLLFMGAMVGVRNPRAHGIVEEKDAYSTMEYLMLASMLAKRVDEPNRLK
jgi:hypothetical protein